MTKRGLFLVVLAVALCALAACGDDDVEPEPVAVESTEAEESPTPTEEPPTTTTEPPEPEVEVTDAPVTGPTEGLPTPAEAALRLYDDWHAQDEMSARTYATQSAVNELFATSPGPAEFTDCLEEEHHFTCFFYYEGGGINMRVEDTDAYGWIVTDVGFVAD